MAQIESVVQQYRDALTAQEADAFAQLSTAYDAAWVEIEGRVVRLVEQINAGLAEGEQVSASMLFQQARYKQLLAELEKQINQIASDAVPLIVDKQRAAVNLSRQSVIDQIRAGFGREAPTAIAAIQMTQFPTDQLQALLGSFQNGSPLKAILDKLGPAASEQVQNALITGLSAGDNPKTVARLARDAFKGNQATG